MGQITRFHIALDQGKIKIHKATFSYFHTSASMQNMHHNLQSNMLEAMILKKGLL